MHNTGCPLLSVNYFMVTPDFNILSAILNKLICSSFPISIFFFIVEKEKKTMVKKEVGGVTDLILTLRTSLKFAL